MRGDCWMVLRDYSDDGEPHGSAGMPILKPLVGRHVVNILVVVVRYFGV